MIDASGSSNECDLHPLPTQSGIAHMCHYGRVTCGHLDKMTDPRRDGTGPEESRMLDNVNTIQFGLGLLVVLVAASLLLLDVLESGAAIAIGFIGIVLISASGRNRKST
jgi:hypothetical protein